MIAAGSLRLLYRGLVLPAVRRDQLVSVSRN
jgi:hypothetical protein